MMKLGTVTPCLKKNQKYMNYVTHPLSSAYISNFSTGSSEFCYIKNALWLKLSNFLNFFWVFKNSFNKKVTILMMSAKMATPDFLKIKVFWNKNYDVSNKILSRDWHYIVDEVMWPKFGKFSISLREVIIILTF